VCLENQIPSFSSSTKSLEHLHPKAAKTLILLNLANPNPIALQSNWPKM
jgi:hypothetical protein